MFNKPNNKQKGIFCQIDELYKLANETQLLIWEQKGIARKIKQDELDELCCEIAEELFNIQLEINNDKDYSFNCKEKQNLVDTFQSEINKLYLCQLN